MKKFYLFAVAALCCVSSSKAISLEDIPVPPTFNADEWKYIGVGVYTPGVFDYFSTEYPDDLPCAVYESKDGNKDYWIEVNGDNMRPFDLEEGDSWLPVPAPFIVHAANPDKVWTSPIYTMHYLLFNAFHKVPELMGVSGSASNYGHQNGFLIMFPAESYEIVTMPTGTPRTNLQGNFALVLPDPSGVEAVSVDAPAVTEYYTIQGVKVDAPAHGQFYVVKKGNQVKKMVF